MTTGKLAGRAALISGGAGAMGAATAQLYAAEGCAVCLADLDLEASQAIAAKIQADGGQAMAVRLDVRNSAQWNGAVTDAERAFGHLDTLCTFAGANHRVSFDAQTEEMWRRILDINLTGSFLGTKAMIPALRRAGGGVILFTGSLGSLRQGAGSPAYGVSKAGLVALTRSTAASYAGDNIRCVLVNPGHVDTPFIRGNAPHSPNDESTSIDNPENYKRRVAGTPLGRMTMPDDVARTFLFAATDEASMITGSWINVDGGAGI
ncbi:MAG TPA: SDR family oxidoreductase [Candidatus Latescibacteria bacterium]|jgi:NAD(P)-dependent dehydrogenase (short-subunit alcohol dehydrogenase family)|nr:SDR family oxidoreductase [Candidatus Latescibacterota bacterium]HJP29479.1 SDR family oxidoreductase [Candidatus Latescibacterota bacterium]